MVNQVARHMALAKKFYLMSAKIPFVPERHEQIRILLHKADWHLLHAGRIAHSKLSRPLSRTSRPLVRDGFLLRDKITRAYRTYNRIVEEAIPR